MKSPSQEDIFEFTDYRQLIEAWIKGRPRKGHGERSRLAVSMNCQTAFVTHVLKKRAQLSPEQGLRASKHMGHSPDECKYFMALLALDRAATSDLRTFLLKELGELRAQRKNLKVRLKTNQPLNLEAQALYTSRWDYTAIHVCLSIPKLKSPEAISEALNLPLEQVKEVLILLVQWGLAKRNPDGSFTNTHKTMHFDQNFPLIQKHHMNWRLQALRAVERNRVEDVHYSSVISIHSKDEARIREVLVQAIETIREIVRETPDPLDGVYSYCLDFFPVART